MKLKVKSLIIFGSIIFLSQNTYSQDKQINKPEKKIINAVESITLYSPDKKIKKVVKARIDTGATRSSIDKDLAESLGYKNYIGKIDVISSNCTKTRYIIAINFSLSNKEIKNRFTVADRSKLSYKVLIGRSDLKGFLVNPGE